MKNSMYFKIYLLSMKKIYLDVSIKKHVDKMGVLKKVICNESSSPGLSRLTRQSKHNLE